MPGYFSNSTRNPASVCAFTGAGDEVTMLPEFVWTTSRSPGCICVAASRCAVLDWLPISKSAISVAERTSVQHRIIRLRERTVSFLNIKPLLEEQCSLSALGSVYDKRVVAVRQTSSVVTNGAVGVRICLILRLDWVVLRGVGSEATRGNES